MKLTSLHQWLFPPSPSRLRRPTVKLSFELLEDRLVPAWAHSAGGHLVDAGRAVATDRAGNVYVAGTIQGDATFGPGVVLSSAGDNDAFVAKYSQAGALLWAHRMGSTFNDEATAIAVDPGDKWHPTSVYVAGVFRGTVDFGGVTLTSTGARDVYIEKLDAAGNVVWVHQFANNNNFGLLWCGPHGLAVDTHHNVVVNGFFSGHMDMDPANPSVHVLDSVGLHPDVFVAKLSAGGNFLWDAKAIDWDVKAKDWDGVNAYAIAVDSNDNVYTVGAFQSTGLFFDSNNQMKVLSGPPSQGTLYVWKMDAAGHTTWVKKTAECPNAAVLNGLGIAVDAGGSVYTTGSFKGLGVDFDPYGFHSGQDIRNSPHAEAFIQKLDKNGKFLWVRQPAGTRFGQGSGVALDTAGNPYVAGWFADPGGYAHSFVTELNPFGATLGSIVSKYLDPNEDAALGIAVDQTGNVDITGQFANHVQFGALPMLNTAGRTDVYVAQLKLNPVTFPPWTTGVPRLPGKELVDPFAIIDDRHWGPLVGFEQQPMAGEHTSHGGMSAAVQAPRSVDGMLPTGGALKLTPRLQALLDTHLFSTGELRLMAAGIEG